MSIAKKIPHSLREKRASKFALDGDYTKAKNEYKAVLKDELRLSSLIGLAKLESEEGNLNASLNYVSAYRQVYPEIATYSWTRKIIDRVEQELCKKTKFISREVVLDEQREIKIAVIGAIWQRPHLTRIFIEHLNRMFMRPELYKLKFHSFLTVSEPLWKEEETKHRFPFCTFIPIENNPLSLKWQKALDVAKDWEPDLVLIMGSDNFISRERLERMIKLLANDERCHLVGLKDCIFLDNNKIWKWNGYKKNNQPNRAGEPIGAARLFTSDLLKQVKWKLWAAAEINKGLDSLVMKQLEDLGYIYADLSTIPEMRHSKMNLIKVLPPRYFVDSVLDVKTSVNVTKLDASGVNDHFDEWKGTFDEVILKITGSEDTSRDLIKYINDGVE